MNIEYDLTETNYCGEFIAPNIIKVYLYNCNKTNRNTSNVIAHEYIHFIIYKVKILRFIFNKLNNSIIKKCRKRGINSVDDVYKCLADEKVCDFIANRISKRYKRVII